MDNKQVLSNHLQDSNDDELAANAEEEKNYKGMCISFVVISVICSLIVLSIILLTPDDDSNLVKYPRLKIEEIVTKVFEPNEFDGFWVSDNEVVYKSDDENIVLHNILKNLTNIIVPRNIIRQFNVQKYRISADKQFVLLIHSINNDLHYSLKAKYIIYNISNEHIRYLEAPHGKQELDFADFGPKGSQIIYIYENNIYYKSSVADSSDKLMVRTGVIGVIYNGITDWLYRERIWKTNRAFWWSSDGSKIAFACFDDHLVEIISYIKYGAFHTVNAANSTLVTQKYPRAGHVNPTVSLWILDLANHLSAVPKRVHINAHLLNSDHYLTSVSWFDYNSLACVLMQREQNYSLISICSEDKDWVCEKLYDENINQNINAWIEIFDAPLISWDKRYYLLRLSLTDKNNGSRRQIAMISINTGIPELITDETNDVIRILAYSQNKDTVFYEATIAERSTLESHIFSVSNAKQRSSTHRKVSCLTCDQSERECTHRKAIFSPRREYFVLRCLGMNIPWTDIRSVHHNKILYHIETNKNFEDKVKYRAFPHTRTIEVPVGINRVTVQLILPPAFKEDGETKFPLVIEIGFDAEQHSIYKFRVDWGTYIASSRDFIYARLDVPHNRGHQFQTSSHRMSNTRVAMFDAKDCMEVVKYLKYELKYVDKTRIAVWGWAYGGYISATSLALPDQELFNCSIAVAPITNWLNYDSYTAERYFGSPLSTENILNYEKANLMPKAKFFKDKKLFILHGTADENVHIKHSFDLMKALNNAAILYKSLIYPDSNHKLEDVRLHFYRSLESYIDQCFGFDEMAANQHKKK